ncbi:hypothetical protein Hdeb2414_s0022g00615771 [Helianthus debilis subsp. tardiflorus]
MWHRRVTRGKREELGRHPPPSYETLRHQLIQVGVSYHLPWREWAFWVKAW